MSDIYQTTDKRLQDTNPETPRLLLEGIVDIKVSDYYAYSGGYISIASLNISELNDLGNRLKGFPPKTLELKVWKNNIISSGGDIFDYYYPLPYLDFVDMSTGEVKESATAGILNQYIIGDDLSVSLMDITHYSKTLPGRTQSFSYKIYSTIYPFTDTFS